jgi:hypothetical protein
LYSFFHDGIIAQYLLTAYTEIPLGTNATNYMALFYCGGSSSDAFSALIASGILGGLDGKLGFMAWRFEPNCACIEKSNSSDSAAAGGSSLLRAL